MVVGLAVGALVASIAAISIVRNHDADHGRFPDQVVAAPAKVGVSRRADAQWTLDGSTLYVVGETGIDILSGSPLARTGRLESRLTRPDATWSPDRSMVVLSSNEDGEAEVWDVSDGRLLSDVAPGRTSAQPAWSPDGRYLVASDRNGLVVVRDARSGQVSSSFTVFQPGISVLGISWPTPDRMVAVSISRIVTVDAFTGETIWSHASGPSGLVVSSPDGADVVIGQGLSHRHDVYALRDGAVLGDVEVDSRTLLAVVWSPDGHWFVASGDDDRPRLWDATAAVTRDEYPTVAPYAAGSDGTIFVWNVTN